MGINAVADIPMVAQIKQLSAHIAERLRSDLVVTSLTQGIEELVSNSIDAGATEIKVDIKPSQFSFLVEDNGCGIPSASFGQLATRHATSKLHSMTDLVKGLDTLGFRGEALASLAQTANLEITSKAKGTFETHTKILQGGNVLRDGLALEQRTKHGTRVVVRDLFFNRPVRRKHLAGTGLKKELDDCREHILHLALPRPAVGFTLVDSTRKSTILCLKRGRTWKDVLPLVFGQRLVQHGMQREGPVEAELYISRPLEGFSAKSRQYMYVNSRYVANDAASKLLNMLFQQVLQDLSRRGCEQQGAGRRFPAFVCHISCPPGMLDVTARPDKTAVQFTSWAPVLAAVRAAAMHAWHQYVPLGLLKEWRTHASAPAPSQPREVAQPTLMSAAVASPGLIERTAVESASAWEDASCGGAVAAGGVGEGEGLRAHKRLCFSLDEGAGADRVEADPASEQHAAASRQPRMHEGPEGGIPWLSARESACGRGLPCAGEPSAEPDTSYWHQNGTASRGLGCLPREVRSSEAFDGRYESVQRGAEQAHLAECGAPGMHEADTADGRRDLSDWDSEAFDGRDQMAQHATEEAQLAERRLCSMQQADITGAWGSMGSPDRGSGLLDCLQSPTSAAFAAQLPQSPTLDIPLDARAETAASDTARHWQPQLSFRVRRRPSEPPQLHPSLDFRAEALEEEWWCKQPEQAHLNSSSTASDAETLHSAPGSAASPGRHDMAAALGDWMQTDDGVSDELAAALCHAAETKQRSAYEHDKLGSGLLDALNRTEQRQHHRGQGSLHEDRATETIPGARSSRRQRPGGRRRASSAPPHQRPRMRAAHTNPFFSLCSSGWSQDAEHALPDQPAVNEAACQANEGAVNAHGCELARKRKRRTRTFSGVCGRPRFAGSSKVDPFQLRNKGPCAVQQCELLCDAVPVQTSTLEASHAVGPRMDVSAPAKGRSANQSAQAKEEDREAIRVKGGALLQAPARRHRPQRAANANGISQSSRENVLASIAGVENAEPAVKVCQGEVPPSQPGTDQVDTQAQSGSAQLLQWGHSDANRCAVEGGLAPDLAAGGNAIDLDEKAAVRGAGEAIARSSESVAELLRGWVNPVYTSGQRQVPDLASLACGNLLGLVPAAITKESLDAARPLRQVDRKFVPLVCGSQLAIMDQHAADERVQLEHLTAQVIGPGGLPVSVQSCMLCPSQPLDISPAEAHLLDSFRATVEAWGWYWELVPAEGDRLGAAAAAVSADGARLTHAAVVLGTPLNGVELQTFLHQLQSSSGSAKVPPGVLRVLASKACHSAIRFGDELDAGQCNELLSNLKRTRSWHCCAHGRPTVAPLVDMLALQRVIGLRGCVM